MSTSVKLGIDMEATFDPRTALTITEAAKLMRGRYPGKHPHVCVLRRWANPNRGCRIGPLQLLLPTVKYGGRMLTMKEWVEAFIKMRARLGVRQPAAPLFRPRRQFEAAQRHAQERLRQAGLG